MGNPMECKFYNPTVKELELDSCILCHIEAVTSHDFSRRVQQEGQQGSLFALELTMPKGLVSAEKLPCCRRPEGTFHVVSRAQCLGEQANALCCEHLAGKTLVGPTQTATRPSR